MQRGTIPASMSKRARKSCTTALLLQALRRLVIPLKIMLEQLLTSNPALCIRGQVRDKGIDVARLGTENETHREDPV